MVIQPSPFRFVMVLSRDVSLAPTLFWSLLVLAAVLETSSNNLSDGQHGVFLCSRTDGKLFNMARLRAKTRCKEVCVQELLYADDTAMVAQSIEDLQNMLDCFVTVSVAFWPYNQHQ